MPRYVILEHDHPQLHWDLMFEAEAGLRTWRLAEPPQPDRSISATISFYHRSLYLDYEGPIHGDRGWVKRWDTGIFQGDIMGATELTVHMRGNRLQGVMHLKHSLVDQWTFIFKEDV